MLALDGQSSAFVSGQKRKKLQLQGPCACRVHRSHPVWSEVLEAKQQLSKELNEDRHFSDDDRLSGLCRQVTEALEGALRTEATCPRFLWVHSM